MKKVDNTILWLQQATQALKEVEHYLRELNHELDTQHEKYIRHEVRAEYGPDKEDEIMEFVKGELGEKAYNMTVHEVMREIGSAEQCEWCGMTTNEHVELMTNLGDEQICTYCKQNG